MIHRDKRPLVSIGIPTYNRAGSYLPIALESALSQTYENVEIIVSDNGSTDDTESLVRSYGDSRIRYYKQSPALLPTKNFNYCLNVARGEFFLLLHDDDLVDSDFVESCTSGVENVTEVGIVRTGTRIIDENGEIIRHKKNFAGKLSTDDLYLAWFSGKTSFYLPSTLFNRRRLQELGGFESPHNLFLDVFAQLQLEARYGRIDIEDVKASFRVHGDELTFAANVRDWCEDAGHLLELMVSQAPEKKREVRTRGQAFFAKLNYNRATHIKNRLVRYRTYRGIYRYFNASVSPISYFWIRPMHKSVRRRLRKLKHRFGVTHPSSD